MGAGQDTEIGCWLFLWKTKMIPPLPERCVNDFLLPEASWHCIGGEHSSSDLTSLTRLYAAVSSQQAEASLLVFSSCRPSLLATVGNTRTAYTFPTFSSDESSAHCCSTSLSVSSSSAASCFSSVFLGKWYVVWSGLRAFTVCDALMRYLWLQCRRSV